MGETPRESLPDRGTLDARAEALRTDPLLIGLLYGRGVVDEAEQRRYLLPKLADLRAPEAMAGFPAALDLLATARAKRLRVGIFGDYDADGVTTAAILAGYLEALGVEVIVRVADRESGYGFSPAEARALVESGAKVVLTADTGTTDFEALEWLRGRGVATAVIDHHQVPEVDPPAHAFINPHQRGCAFPFKGLCSAGVAFYLCAGLRTALARASASTLPDPRAWLDLVAVATVCDMMPLRDENRVLVRKGLDLLNHLGIRARPGLRALREIAGIEADIPVDAGHVAFRFGPRINAPGRLGPAEPALRLLMARSMAEAKPLAEHVELLNLRRKGLVERMITEAEALALVDADAAAVVVAHERWHSGVVGIAAAQLAERRARPAAVLAIDLARGTARGSVRSVGGIDVRAALAACSDLLVRFGGHPQAAGLELRSDRVDEFRIAFCEAVARGGSDHADARELHDGPIALRELALDRVTKIRTLGPFGTGFAPPRFVCRARAAEVRVLKERHLALVLEQDGVRMEAIAFGQGETRITVGAEVEGVFEPFLDSFRGLVRVRLRAESTLREIDRFAVEPPGG